MQYANTYIYIYNRILYYYGHASVCGTPAGYTAIGHAFNGPLGVNGMYARDRRRSSLFDMHACKFFTLIVGL